MRVLLPKLFKPFHLPRLEAGGLTTSCRALHAEAEGHADKVLQCHLRCSYGHICCNHPHCHSHDCASPAGPALKAEAGLARLLMSPSCFPQARHGQPTSKCPGPAAPASASTWQALQLLHLRLHLHQEPQQSPLLQHPRAPALLKVQGFLLASYCNNPGEAGLCSLAWSALTLQHVSVHGTTSDHETGSLQAGACITSFQGRSACFAGSLREQATAAGLGS